MDLNQLAKEKGAIIVISDGYCRIAYKGAFELNEKVISYQISPDKGVIAKTSSWKKMEPAKKEERLTQVLSDSLKTTFEQDLAAFVGALIKAYEQYNFQLDGKSLETLKSCKHSSSDVFKVILARAGSFAEKVKADELKMRVKSSFDLSTYPDFFTLAKSIPRKFIAVLGEPNSGKTHEAMLTLSAAKSGVYLAPLRLLALENYERLIANGICASLVTGEEKRIDPRSQHIVSTIEMLDFNRKVDVAIIDEVQMLDDKDRGSAWTAAICGVPADVVYLVGSLTAEDAVIALAKRLKVPLEIVKKQRKGELEISPAPVSGIKNLKKGDALIAFSRRDVLFWRDTLTEKGYSVATVYGNLSPEVRQAQAALFRSGEADILVGTDALAMGLNMPISRVVFTTAEKYNGTFEEEIPAWLTQQIGGRAGRYGITEKGFVVGFDASTHSKVRGLMKEKLHPIKSAGFYVTPNIEYLRQLSSATGYDALAKLLNVFARDVEKGDSFFLPAITNEQMERALWLDAFKLSLEDRFLLSLAPIASNSTDAVQEFQGWVANMTKGRQSFCISRRDQVTAKSLQFAENDCKIYSAYSWLSYRRPDFFPDGDKALKLALSTSVSIDSVLKKSNLKRAKSVKAA